MKKLDIARFIDGKYKKDIMKQLRERDDLAELVQELDVLRMDYNRELSALRNKYYSKIQSILDEVEVKLTKGA